jgi:hypothetical protein
VEGQRRDAGRDCGGQMRIRTGWFLGRPENSRSTLDELSLAQISLINLSMNVEGNVISRDVGVTFDVLEAEGHKTKSVEYEFKVFAVLGNWREDAELSKLMASMRDFREMVKAMQDEALR